MIRIIRLGILIHLLVNYRIICSESADKPRPVNLEDHLQPDDVISGEYDYNEHDNQKHCARDCTVHWQPRICYYKFIVEQYHAMGPACLDCKNKIDDCNSPQCVAADGIEKTIITVNRRIPGPSIQICLGDRVIVDVHNKTPARGVTVHWHGIEQIGTPWMDGVPNVSQCAINEGQTFRYNFVPDKAGTNFWHSHAGLLMLDGFQGNIVIRESSNSEPHTSLYDYDLYSHVIQIQDWIHGISDNKFPGYNADPNMIGDTPDSYLINGRGRYRNPKTGETVETPYAVFNVRPNAKYRFRVVTGTNISCSCAIAVENHPLLLIATDGRPIVPVEVGSIMLTAGEMYDFVIETNKTPQSYWIRVQGYETCAKAFQSAILRYEGSTTELIPNRESSANIINALGLPQVNNPESGYDGNNPKYVRLDSLTSEYPVPANIFKEEPDARYILSAGMYVYPVKELFQSNTYHRFNLPGGGGVSIADTLGNVSSVFPPFPISSQDSEIPKRIICPDNTDVCSKQICECVNLIKVRLGDVVEFVVTDDILAKTAKFMHPIHVHGFRFYVLKQGTLEERKKADYYKNVIDSSRPVLKHTIGVPDDGFVVFRFVASNPGAWYFHCHFLFHGHGGMNLILQIGERTEFPKPPDDFPRCGDYLPPVFLSP